MNTIEMTFKSGISAKSPLAVGANTFEKRMGFVPVDFTMQYVTPQGFQCFAAEMAG